MKITVSVSWAAEGGTPDWLSAEADADSGNELLYAADATKNLITAIAAIAAPPRPSAPTATVTLESDGCDHMSVHVNGQEVATGNHDDHGWSGMDAIADTARKVAEAAGLTVEDNR